jgi:hypothetical protein
MRRHQRQALAELSTQLQSHARGAKRAVYGGLKDLDELVFNYVSCVGWRPHQLSH